MSLPLRLAAVPVVVVAVAAGVWLTGAVLTEDATVAMVLTGLWFGLAGAVALFVGWRWRPLALPVVGTYLVTATVLGGYLLFASTVDKVVNEDVVVAAPKVTTSSSSSASASIAPSGPVEIASGQFTNQAHDTSGLATLIEQPNGDRVVTLTRFKTDPGPDVRVYLVPRPGRQRQGRRRPRQAQGQQGRPAVRRAGWRGSRRGGHLVPGVHRRLRHRNPYLR